jgi:hypothetical protein
MRESRCASVKKVGTATTQFLIAVWVKACQRRGERSVMGPAPRAALRESTSAVALSDRKIWPPMCSGVKAVGWPLYSTWEPSLAKVTRHTNLTNLLI